MNAKRRKMSKKPNGTMFYRFPKENNRTVSKQAQNNEESTEIAEFYLENKKKSKQVQCSSSENPLEKKHSEIKLPVEA